MNFCKSLLLVSLTLLSNVIPLLGQQVEISPIPQSITWGEKAFNNTTAFHIINAQNIDTDIINLLQSQVNTDISGIELIIGERGDAIISPYEKEIPTTSEGYYLNIESDKVVIAGNDNSGTFYGVQSFLQILSSTEVYSVTIKDFPSVVERGMIEGFYGNPFSHQDRVNLFDFFGRTKMNVYIYGPKDDPYHGFGNKWRDPYPPKDAKRMKELIEHAHKNKVNFVWAVHPGNNISWEDKNGDGIVDDFVACKLKFEKMYDLGVRSFAVFFDDISGIGTDAKNQAKMMNYLTKEFVNKKHDVAPLILCPTQYNKAWSGGSYLGTLGTKMDESVRIMWTGNSVVDMINKSDMDWINKQIKRNAYIWLNYPVTDYCIDHLLMGKTYGNDLNIASQLSGFAANPMEYAEASKVSLFSIADYTWNMPAYKTEKSWLRAMHFLMPENYDAFKIFCENNVDLGPTGHGLRREGESLPFKEVATPFIQTVNNDQYNNNQANQVKLLFESFSNSSDQLRTSTENPAMIEEIKPWLDVFDLMGKRGVHLINMYKALHDNDSVLFIDEYLKAEELKNIQDTIRSRDFPGSIKAPYPKPANEVVAPYIKQLQTILVTQYKNKFSYRTDIFPTIVLENGNYYIKFNGKYLTNRNVNGNGGNPLFIENFDSINPQRQEWTISVDASTERYSIKNTQDNRYVNELGNFGTNPYSAAWNTYILRRYNGKYAIQNAGSAGNKLWNINNNRITLENDGDLSESDFIFEIIPVGQDSVNHTMIKPSESYYIKQNDLYLTNNNVNGNGGTPTFKVLENEDTEKSQLWLFSIDKTSDRIKIVSAADNRYVNEFGIFGTNPYYPSWNTYVLTEIGGKFAIRNGGDAGRDFWKIRNGRIEKGNQSEAESYLFEIIASKKTTSLKKKQFLKNCTIMIDDNYVFFEGIEIKAMSIYNINGEIIYHSKGENKINISRYPKAVYIIKVTNKKDQSDSFKLIL